MIACKNTSGAAIAQGTPVYQTGTVGATATIEIAPADALISANKLPAIGLLQTDLNNNGLGNVVITGELTNFTTDPIDGVTPTTGDKVFVKSGGGLTLTKPTGEGNGIQNMGLVGKVSGGNAGSITVSSIMRTNDVPNLPEGRIWVGDGNTIVSDTVYIDEPNNRLGIGTTIPNNKLHLYSNNSSADALLKLEQDGTGDASIDFLLTSTNLFRIGVDHSNNDALTFAAGSFGTGLDYMVIRSGKVGIGTTSPAEKLHVGGNTQLQDATLASTSKTTLIPLTSGGNSQLKIKGGNFLHSIAFETSWNDFEYAKLTGGYNTGDSKLEINKSDALGAIDATTRISTGDSFFAGNVGIGTISPNTKLEISGGHIRLADAYSLQWGSANNRIYNQSNSTVFINNASESMRIISSGNVGIGTTSPTKTLDVNGEIILGQTVSATVDASYLLARTYSGQSEEPMAMMVMSSAISNNTLNVGGGSSLYNAATALNFITAGTTATRQGSSRMYINSSGNVGIGTTSPSQKLHVEGNARVSTNFYIGNVDAVTTATEVLVRQSERVRGITPANLIDAIPAPATPGSIVSTIVGQTIEVEFDESTTSNIDYYQVWSSDDGGGYGIIAQIPPTDFSATMTVVDTSFSTGGTMSYRVYAVKSGVYSSPGTTSKTYTVGALDVTDMTVTNLNTAYYIQYEKPASRFIDHIEIYMDSQTTQGALNRSNASIIYSGQNTSFMKSVGVSNNFHQFWVEVVTT